MLVSALFGYFMMPSSEEYGPYLQATSVRFVTEGKNVDENESRGIVHLFDNSAHRTLVTCLISRQMPSSPALS